MSKKTLTKHIVNLTKENFIKFDDQQKVLQIVNEAILQYKEELKTFETYQLTIINSDNAKDSFEAIITSNDKDEIIRFVMAKKHSREKA